MKLRDTNSENEHYYLFSAVRGPDLLGSALGRELKSLFTARIRSIVFEVHECPGDWTDDAITPDVLDKHLYEFYGLATPYLNLNTQRQWEDLAHFREHLVAGILSSQKETIWGGVDAAIRFSGALMRHTFKEYLADIECLVKTRKEKI